MSVFFLIIYFVINFVATDSKFKDEFDRISGC